MTPDNQLTADELSQKYNADLVDGEHPQYLRAMWRQEVMCSMTLRGYWDWVAGQIEEED